MRRQLTEIEAEVDPNGTYTTLQVARLLGMAVRSVQLMVDRGDLQAWKTPGGHRRITGESLRAWIRRSRTPAPPQEARRRATRGRAAPCVLLIEDSAHFQQLVQLLMRQRFPDVQLHVADDGISGLVSFGQLQPDLLIVDILLPGIDGASMILGLRNHALFGRCELIVLTALDEAQRADYAHALQGVTVVHKPDLMRELPGLIERALGARLSPPSAPASRPAAATAARPS
ncbi:Regulator of RpoS [Tepidimonas sediminis]|uniref:Regulator of RpoS n=1 Tax=Tepidimonas sediminis TaxID=2588941 RepID=A0A554WR57_9BURK|nr:response regulator [Tepidimonas sediminis]TSE26067.1 Regulator of RpoS [Tepidimonas sediminis]